jgi:hypothetical protein
VILLLTFFLIRKNFFGIVKSSICLQA